MTKIIRLDDLTPLDQPEEIFKEVRHIFHIIFPGSSIEPVEHVFKDILRMFHGKFPGYRQANTFFHDLNHTTSCLLAMARLIHGATVEKIVFTEKEVILGLISALTHDTGYIQRLDECEGTGARYTATHIKRSIEFIREYFSRNGYSRSDFDFCSSCLGCTGLDVKIPEISFQSRNHEIVGKMIGSADLLGQMADRYYLEKLPFLYKEFEEGNIPGFKDLMDFLTKSEEFYQLTKMRLADELEGVNGYLRFHFKARWSLDQDIYQETIDRNIGHLKYILREYKKEFAHRLRRGDWMIRYRELYEELNNGGPA